MDRFLKENLKELVFANDDGSQGPRVSIFAPMYRAGREVQQNEVRFKNLLNSARDQLTEIGCEQTTIAAILAPAMRMLEDADYWQHQSDGLALFLADGFSAKYRLPYDFDELVVVGKQFHIRPLTRVLTDDQQWYILAASPKRIRLLKAYASGVDDSTPDTFPENLRDALNIDEYMSALQFHSTSYNSMPGRGEAIHHGHGGSDPDVKKQDEILQYFHRLDTALSDYLNDEKIPLLFAGVEYLFPIFKEACHYDQIVEQPITGNPDDLSAEELHEKSLEIMEPRIRERRAAIIDAYQDKAHSDWASDDLSLVLESAGIGQVEQLIIDPSKRQWAIFNDRSEPQFVEENMAEAEELINRIAVDTILYGGEVLAVSEESAERKSDDGDECFCPESGVAAIFRSPVKSFLNSRS